MADVMYQRKRFHEVFIQAQDAGDGAGKLSDLNCRCQAVAEVIGEACGEDLRFVFEATERARVHDTVSVPLIIIAITVRRLGKAPTATRRGSYCVFTHNA